MSKVLYPKAKAFSVRAVSTCHQLMQNHEYILSKQFLRSATSIGANIAESDYAQSPADFVSKLSIALKEAAETRYWLELLRDTGYLDDRDFAKLYSDCTELIKLLTASVNTAKSRTV